MAPERLILVDGSSLIYRAYFAIPANFSTSQGLPTNAIYGFATMFKKVLSGKTPERGAVIFEAPESEVEEVCGIAKDKMEAAVALKVPLIADVGVGQNWAEAH